MLYWLLSILIFSLLANFAINIALGKGKMPFNTITKALRIALPIIGMACAIGAAIIHWKH